jgi:nicotinamide riboside kinase
MDIDLPWEFDPLREHPHQRRFLFDRYKTELDKSRFNYRVISGVGEDRLRNALEIVDAII